MPIKFSKSVSTHLFKYVKAVDIKFNAFDKRSTSTKELVRRLKAPRFSKSNPKMAVNIDINSKPDPPSVTFRLADGNELFFDSRDSKIEDMMFNVHLTAMQLDNQYEMDGKNIEDEL